MQMMMIGIHVFIIAICSIKCGLADHEGTIPCVFTINRPLTKLRTVEFCNFSCIYNNFRMSAVCLRVSSVSFVHGVKDKGACCMSSDGK